MSSYGYAVVEINQASGRAESFASEVELTRADADYVAQMCGERLIELGSGRRERYVVVELVGVDDDE